MTGYSHLEGIRGGPSKLTSNVKKRPWPFIIVGCLLAVSAIVIPVAVVVSKPGDGSNDSGPSSVRSSSHSASPKLDLAPKPRWDFDKDKMVGLNLGNWLILERWMAEDWFVQLAGPTSWDEWGFTMTQGNNASAALEEHWSTWVTEADVERAFQAGINTFRVPLPFWMWIGTVSPEPYVTKGQMAHFEQLCAWAYARSMYIIMDLHGLPGSQNGEQQSGLNTTKPTFFQPINQARSDQVVKAVVDWIAQSPYYSIISAIEVANEPRPYTTQQRAMLRAYYERSYATIQTLADKAPAMFFADGFVPGDKFAYWWDFAASHKTTPSSLLYTDHPYPGYFPAQNNSADILKQTCTKGANYANFPVPTVITEWSLRTGIQNATFEKQYYEAQLSVWTWFSGSVFWSIRALDSKVNVLADPVAQYQWSFETLLDRGSIATPTAKNTTTTAFLNQLKSPCGKAPTAVRDGPAPQGSAAAAAIADAAAAKAMIDDINKQVTQAAVAMGLSGSGAAAVMASSSTKSRSGAH